MGHRVCDRDASAFSWKQRKRRALAPATKGACYREAVRLDLTADGPEAQLPWRGGFPQASAFRRLVVLLDGSPEHRHRGRPRKLGHSIGYGAVAVLGGVLVPERRRRRRVPAAGHELAR